MKEKNLIFDIDGTLWDSTGLVARGYNLQIADEGLQMPEVTPAVLKTLFGKTMTEIADRLFDFVPVPERYALMERCMVREHEVLEADPCHIAFPGVVETLEKLAEDYDLYIVSNSQKGYPQLTMEKLGVTHLFKGHLCFGDTGTSKGRTILRLMGEHGMESAVYIGDTQGDYEATLEAKVPFVFCAYGFGAPQGWTARIEKIEDLLTLDL